MATDSADNQETKGVVFLKGVLGTLARRARRKLAYGILLVIPYNLGLIVIICALVAVFQAGVIPAGTRNTILFWYAVFQVSSPLIVGAAMGLASYVKFSRKIAGVVANVPRDIVWVYKGVRSGVFKNKFYIFLCLTDGDSFQLISPGEETDEVINSFEGLYPEVSRGWDELALSRFKSDPSELRRMPVYTDKVRTI